MGSWLEAIRISVSFLFLAYSAWKDYRDREISNTVWLFFAPIGFFLSLLQAFLKWDITLLTLLAVSFLVMTGLSLLLFYLDFFGGADAKALMCLSVALPSYPAMLKPYLDLVLPVFSLSILTNAVLASSLIALGIVVYNVSMYVTRGGRFFEGLEDEPVVKRLVAFVTGIRVDLSKTKDVSHFLPLETLSRASDGKIHRRLHLFPRVNREEAQDLTTLRDLSKESNGDVWVTPSVPFLVFLLVGFVAALVLGDVLFSLMFSMFR